MKEWWFNLNLREKQTVSLGVAVTIMALLYGLIWSPLHTSVNALRDQIQHNQQLLSWMQTADQQIQAAAKMTPTPTVTHNAASWLSIVQDNVKQSPLAKNLTQLVQADNDSVKLTFQQVDFDLLISWLTELWQQQGLVVTQLTITSGSTPGIVGAEFILKSA